MADNSCRCSRPSSPPPWRWTGPSPGRIFFEQLIRDNIDIGRPDKVNIVFDRKIRLRGKNPTPGTFRTQVITSGVCPYLYLYYKNSRVKQYLNYLQP